MKHKLSMYYLSYIRTYRNLNLFYTAENICHEKHEFLPGIITPEACQHPQVTLKSTKHTIEAVVSI